ncbi:hypothetical protein ACFX1Z_018557 [Malus domestica]
MYLAKVRCFSISESDPPPRIDPRTTEHSNSGAVLWRWIYSSCSIPKSDNPSEFLSTTCPATSPSNPIDLANSPTALMIRVGETPTVDPAMCSKAKAKSASSAKTATAWLTASAFWSM